MNSFIEASVMIFLVFMVADNYAYSNRGFKGSKKTRSKSVSCEEYFQLLNPNESILPLSSDN